MRPLTLTRPKQLLEFKERPILEHIFESLPDSVTDVVLVIGYLGDQIKSHFGEKFAGKNIQYLWQKEKLGTAHALGLAKEILGKDRFLMLYGDDLIDKKSISKLLNHDLALLVKEVPDPRRFGVVLTDEKGKIIELLEKPENPPSKLASTGVKILDSRIFEYPAAKHPNGEYYITDSLAKLARNHDIFIEHADSWVTFGTPEDLERFNADFKVVTGKI